jgi:hypothetical protein
VNDGGQQPSSSTAAVDGNSVNCDYISLHDLIGDMAADNDGGGDDEQGVVVLGPRDAEIFENVDNYIDQDDVLFGNTK